MDRIVPPTWRDLLAEATTVSEVVAVAQDFLDRLEPFELALLPARCKPRPLHSLRDLNEYAVDLKAHYGEGEEQQVVDRIAEVIVEASQRLSIVFGSGPRPRYELVDWTGVAALNEAPPASPR
jgi:hypothetical protein